MNILIGQKDMRSAHYNGAPGILVSGIVWASSAVIAYMFTPQMSIIFFFFGGMMIYPLSTVLSKVLKRSGKHKKENPLATLAMESTLILFVGLYLAYLMFQSNPLWFYPIMLLTIGMRYVIFQSVYGMKIYWVLGLLLVLVGFAALQLDLSFSSCPAFGGALEIFFASILFVKERTNNSV